MNKINNNLVSIIMSCHNGDKYLKQSINSVRNQQYQFWELIFWDNNSSDKSLEIAKKFSLNDKRIKIFRSRYKHNISVARNQAFKKSNGQIITFLDVDDFWDIDKLRKQVEIFNNNQSIKLVYSNYEVFNQTKKTKRKAFNSLPSGEIMQDLINSYCVGLLTLAITRNVFIEFNGFEEKFHIIGDFDLVLKIAHKYEVYAIQKSLATYRLHTTNESNTKRELMCDEMNDWLKSKIVTENSRNFFFDKMYNDINYCKSVSYFLKGKKYLGIKKMAKVKSIYYKSRLLALIFLPTVILKLIIKYRLL